MKTTFQKCLLVRTSFVALLAVMAILFSPGQASAQWLTLGNPHWNITLTDAGYSDFMLDNTPGFEGREYLSGEWAAAVGYQLSGGTVVSPQWLEKNFIFPDWVTTSTFGTRTPLTQTGLNGDGLPIAQSVLTNNDLEITLRHEMLDTVVGTPMGITPASATNAAVFISSDRYVLKQTCTIKNISGQTISGVQFFQLLHGLSSQRGVFDSHAYSGTLSNYHYDVTLAGVDPWSVGLNSSSVGLEDYIGFHANVAPSAFEIGYFGIEGNGVDDHGIGKPSDGVHLSVENNWLTAPYDTRQGRDNFSPVQHWVSGAQRWNLGDLNAGQSVSIDLILSLRTGTKVITGTGSSGGCNGGSSVPGGLDYEFEDVSDDGSCFGEFSEADENEIAIRIANGDFEPFTFLTPGDPSQLWKVTFNGAFSGAVHLTFGYDATVLPPGFDEENLCIYQFAEGVWQKLDGVVDTVTHSISVTATSLTSFALGMNTLQTFTVDATVAPANSGTIHGAGIYGGGAMVSIIATANAGYVFANWTENASVTSTSPSYTFQVKSNRALVANFISVGAAKSISTSSSPANGGVTAGDGAYALGSSATVSATANSGYKFSKWLENGASVSTAKNYTFTVTGDRALVAKFKPVYSMAVTANPASGGDVEADPFYEMGELAKLKAKPNPGWSFVNWTQNGLPVSTETNFQFNVTGNRTLVGNFAFGKLIKATAFPGNAGDVVGGGVYPAGEFVFVEATANPGYVFVEWTEDGLPVSTDPVFMFVSSTNCSLVANFVAQPSLTSTLSGGGVITFSWPAAATDWSLQESPDLSQGSWVNSTRPVTVVGNQNQVNVSTPTGGAFFRLIRP